MSTEGPARGSDAPLPELVVAPPELRLDSGTAVQPQPFWDPYYSGVLLGVVVFASFFTTGHGLGASGALARLMTLGLRWVAPREVDSHSFFANLGGGALDPLANWLVPMVLGAMLGGALSGWLARRMRFEITRGPSLSPALRLVFALLGGLIVGWGTQLSRGCTSGQALSGGAVLAAGSWAFMFAVFGGGYLVVWPLRRLWR